MTPAAVPVLEVNAFVEAYEDAQRRAGAADLATFLPDRSHPLYRDVLRELVRVDLEYGWERGQPTNLDDYRRRFPELFADAVALQEIAFEDYRQRLLAGEGPSPEDYRRHYGVNAADWPTSLNGDLAEPASRIAGDGASASSWGDDPVRRDDIPGFRDFRVRDADSFGPPDATIALGLDAAELYRDVRRSNPAAAYRLAHALAAMPEVGTDFLSFQLLEELGCGAFGRVFLARQGALANRLVALKISTDLFEESQALAQLQHTHIVPIYSVHQSGPFQAVCMPYLGSTTLAAVCKGLHDRPSLPDSGKHFVSTIQDRKSTLRPDERSRTPAAVPPAPPPAAPRAKPPAEPTRIGQFTGALETLEGFTYVQAVVWLGARLADGLAHAHARGIFHRDLKPANVLLTDDGQPMLLDFNLSEDTKLRRTAAAARVGGTLPYMAPEQLEAFRDRTRAPADGRSDLYALGVLLYELLTGRHPFELPSGPVNDVLPQLIEERRQPPPRLRCWNKAVSPAVEAVVRRCLEHDPDRRYPSARALQEDLDGHLADRPLKYIREPSWRERAAKWRRRHPRLTSATSVAVAAAVLLAALGALTAGLWRQREVHRAGDLAREFEAAKLDAGLKLNSREPDGLDLVDGVEQARAALERYGVLGDPNWTARREFRYLPAAEQDRVREGVADLLWSLARAAAQQADRQTHPDPARDERLAYALELNGRAQQVLGDRPAKALLWQQAELVELSGRKEDAKQLFGQVDKIETRSARDYYQLALKLNDRGLKQAAYAELRKAVALLEVSKRRDPRDFWAWYLLGNCYDSLQNYSEAVPCYTACTALNPKSYPSYYKLGLMFARQRRWQKACDTLTQAIALRPDLPEAYVERGIARKELRNYQDAERDFTSAIDLGSEVTRVYFWRAEVRDKLGDRKGHEADFAEGMRREPKDEGSWVDRGLARMNKDPRGALADFDQALRLNRRFFPAWQDKAHVLSELLHRDDEALRAEEQAVALFPESVEARLGRGVLLARLGKREAAIAEAREALGRDGSPPTLYQAANIFALTSKLEPLDKREALPLLSRALLGGFGLDVIDRDPDMDPIRRDPEFRRIVDAARKLRAEAAPADRSSGEGRDAPP